MRREVCVQGAWSVAHGRPVIPAAFAAKRVPSPRWSVGGVCESACLWVSSPPLMGVSVLSPAPLEPDPLSFLKPAVCVTSPSFLVSPATALSILLIFSKSQFWVLLIFFIVYPFSILSISTHFYGFLCLDFFSSNLLFLLWFLRRKFRLLILDPSSFPTYA